MCSYLDLRCSELVWRPRDYSKDEVPLFLAYREFYLRVLVPEKGASLGDFGCTLKILLFFKLERVLRGSSGLVN